MSQTETDLDTPQPEEPVAVMSVGEETAAFANLSASLTEIRKLKGVVGYILRSDTSAIVDLSEQAKISQYALLSSEIHKSSVRLSKQFSLGHVESVLVEGKDLKVLCMGLGENKVSIFLEQMASYAWIVKRILL